MDIIYEQGRCIESGSHELFFSERPTELAAAQAICAECEVRIPCLESALEGAVEWGVWGGVIFWDGKPFYRKRGRGRPRKQEQQLPLEASFDDLRQLVKSA
jgi:WhiB family redox-sensing transcriptional regulator